MQDCIDHGKTKSLRPEGYAMVLNPYKEPRVSSLHRIVYCDANNIHMKESAGLCVRHKCDNPRCINPEHLEVGTWGDNNRDRAQRGRSAKVIPSRQKLNSVQVAEIKRRYTKVKPYNKPNPNGVTALAKEFNVDTNVIYKVVRGTYVCNL